MKMNQWWPSAPLGAIITYLYIFFVSTKPAVLNPFRGMHSPLCGTEHGRGRTQSSGSPPPDWMGGGDPEQWIAQLGKPLSNPGQDGDMRHANCVDVLYKRLPPRLNLRRSDEVGAWKVVFLSKVRDKRTGQWDYHLPQLSVELSRFGFSGAALKY